MVDLALVVEADGAHAAGPAVGLGLLTRELAAVGLPAHVVALALPIVVGPASPAAAAAASSTAVLQDGNSNGKLGFCMSFCLSNKSNFDQSLRY